jgi:hypothetical protein
VQLKIVAKEHAQEQTNAGHTSLILDRPSCRWVFKTANNLRSGQNFYRHQYNSGGEDHRTVSSLTFIAMPFVYILPAFPLYWRRDQPQSCWSSTPALVRRSNTLLFCSFFYSCARLLEESL